MLVRQHESFVEELSVQLQFKEPITSSGAVMTLPAATADLKDWMADRRKFLTVQYDDWMQVIADFRDSVSTTGPKLRAIVASSTTQIDALLQGLFSSTTAADGKLSYGVDAAVRADVLQQLKLLESELATEAAIVAAWRDLVKSSQTPNRLAEEISFRRDVLFAVAQRRNLDVVGSFGTFARADSVLTDVADAVQEELDRAAGVEHQRVLPPSWEPSSQPPWRRLQLCEQVLTRPPYRGGLHHLAAARAHVPPGTRRHSRAGYVLQRFLSEWLRPAPRRRGRVLLRSANRGSDTSSTRTSTHLERRRDGVGRRLEHGLRACRTARYRGSHGRSEGHCVGGSS